MARGSSKYAAGSRPAVDRGIPAPLVDALIAATGIQESEITRDARLGDDIGLDEFDLVELALTMERHYRLPIEDEILDEEDGWQTVADVMKTVARGKARS